jgi:hypothetical protein
MASAEQVKIIAEQLLPQFLPKDDKATTLSFHFTMAPATTYRVSFSKKTNGAKTLWELTGYEEVKP